MALLDNITDAIANPKRVRLCQERASARAFSGLGPKMKAIRDTSPECVDGVVGLPIRRTDSHLSAMSSQSSSRNSSRPPSQRQSTPTPPGFQPRSQLQRSQSDIPVKSPVIQPRQEFTPCITAMELTPDQMKKNYSCDDLAKWDRSQNPMIPLNQTMGLGRYAHGKNANRASRLEHVSKQTVGITYLGDITANLDMKEMTGISDEEWQEIACRDPRRASTTSSIRNTRGSSPSLGPNRSESIPRFLPGYSSGSSSRSSQIGTTLGRKGSSLSTMTLPLDIETPPFAIPLKRTSPLSNEVRASDLLSTIQELHTDPKIANGRRRKVEKPCQFSGGGDPDSAVASDAETDSDWTDLAETIPQETSILTQMFKEGRMPELPTQQQLGVPPAMLDRSKTIRAPRPEPKARRSKLRSTQEKDYSETAIDVDQTHEQSNESAGKSSAGLEIRIPNPVKEQIKYQPPKDVLLGQPVKAGIKIPTGLTKHIAYGAK